jgi:hypothetical protein
VGRHRTPTTTLGTKYTRQRKYLLLFEPGCGQRELDPFPSTVQPRTSSSRNRSIREIGHCWCRLCAYPGYTGDAGAESQPQHSILMADKCGSRGILTGRHQQSHPFDDKFSTEDGFSHLHYAQLACLEGVPAHDDFCHVACV